MSENTMIQPRCLRCDKVIVGQWTYSGPDYGYLCAACVGDPATPGCSAKYDPDLGQDAQEIRRQEDRMSTVQSVVSAPSRVVTDPLANERCAACGRVGRPSVRYNHTGEHMEMEMGQNPAFHRRTGRHLDLVCLCGFEWERDCLDTKGEGA